MLWMPFCYYDGIVGQIHLGNNKINNHFTGLGTLAHKQIVFQMKKSQN